MMSSLPWGRVPADHVAVVERLGRVERVVPAGERVMRRPVTERVTWWGLEVTRTDVSVARHRDDFSPMSATEPLGC